MKEEKKENQKKTLFFTNNWSKKMEFITLSKIYKFVEHLYLTKCLEIDENIILLKNAIMFMYDKRKEYVKSFMMVTIYRDHLKSVRNNIGPLENFILIHLRVILYDILKNKESKHSKIKYQKSMINALKYHKNILQIKTNIIIFSKNIEYFYKLLLSYRLQFIDLKFCGIY